MRSDLTDITVVLDRSGSMSAIRKDAEGGLNAFIAEQRKLPGNATFTLVQFDDRYEVVHNAKPLADVPHCELLPRGSTALLDALGRAITETGERLKGIAESGRPGLIVFVVITDGEENSSREFSLAKVKELIEHQQSVYKWQFTYLGANQDAFAEAGRMGFAQAGVGNYSAANTGKAYASASSNVARMRSAAAAGAPVQCSYTDDERKAMS